MNDKYYEPIYLYIILPKYIVENDSPNFPINNFLYLDGKILLRLNLKTKELLDWKKEYGEQILWSKVTDCGTYLLKNNKGNTISKIDEYYAPNKVIPPSDGFGDYIELHINTNGDIINQYDYDKIDFRDFNIVFKNE